jgi:hypothetical protein
MTRALLASALKPNASCQTRCDKDVVRGFFSAYADVAFEAPELKVTRRGLWYCCLARFHVVDHVPE